MRKRSLRLTIRWLRDKLWALSLRLGGGVFSIECRTVLFLPTFLEYVDAESLRCCWAGERPLALFVGGMSSPAVKRVRRASNPMLASEPSLARQGRSSSGADNGTEEAKESGAMSPDAKAETVPGRRRDCMAIFWRRRARHQLLASGGVDVQRPSS